MGLVATDQISVLRHTIGAVVAGSQPLSDLDDLATRLGEVLPIGDDTLDRLWGRVELLLAEHSMKHLDDAELRAELAVLAPIPVYIGPVPRFYTTTSSGARTLLSQLAQVVGSLPVGADTRSLAALV